jgi:hypothetical protein
VREARRAIVDGDDEAFAARYREMAPEPGGRLCGMSASSGAYPRALPEAARAC